MYGLVKNLVIGSAVSAFLFGAAVNTAQATDVIAFGGDLEYHHGDGLVDLRINHTESDEAGLFIKEKRVTVENLLVNSSYSNAAMRTTTVEMVSGTFDSFYFHFDRMNRDRRVRKYRGWVEFDRNIEGMIGEYTLLRKAEKKFGLKNVRYNGAGAMNPDDDLRIAVRGNRLEFRMNVSRGTDGFRILVGQEPVRNVAAEEDNSATLVTFRDAPQREAKAIGTVTTQ